MNPVLPVPDEIDDYTQLATFNDSRFRHQRGLPADTLVQQVHAFTVATAHFLTRFSDDCVERLIDMRVRINKVQAVLDVLDARLDSLPDVPVAAAQPPEPEPLPAPEQESTGPASPSAPDASPQEAEDRPPPADELSEDLKPFAKQMSFGVPPMAVAARMTAFGYSKEQIISVAKSVGLQEALSDL
jgi:hypothetical protein